MIYEAPLSVPGVAIFNQDTGAIVLVGPRGTEPWEGQSWVPLPTGYDETTHSWNTTARQMVEDPAKIEVILVGKVKATNEGLVKTAYSQNYGKQKKYSRKQAEVMDFRALTPALGNVNDALSATLSVFVSSFNGMALATRRKKFRFAMAQAAKRGVSIDVIIGEFEAAIEMNEAKVANWEAVELEAIRAIKTATTVTAKRAAYAAINWNWTA